MKKYVAYYRVSTKKQGDTGLGLSAQKKTVKDFVEGSNLLAEFTEVESGRKDYRPQLHDAIDFATENEATLVIARIDRLSRNAAFTMALKDSGIDFVAVDMPDANKLTIGILALIAQEEAERISRNTKAALAALKAQGKKLGNPQNLSQEGRDKSIATRKARARAKEPNKKAIALINAYEGMSLWFIARKLNKAGFKTSNGCDFTSVQVSRLKKLYNEKNINSNNTCIK